MENPSRTSTDRKTSLKLDGTPINLDTFDTFLNHPWIERFISQYKRDAMLAHYAVQTIVSDLYDLNEKYKEKYNRVIFTSVDGRVKELDSFMRKLFKKVTDCSKNEPVTQNTLDLLYTDIKDLCGIRFSCSYFDEVKPIINKFIRPQLGRRGYATDLSEPIDYDCLDNGDDFGYRSFHFFVKIPTVVNIYGDVEPCLCEVQGRTELQHVWAVKSHNLLYKRNLEIEPNDIIVDMREVSNSLRALDQFLISIRNRIGEKTNYEL